jgi:DNA-binding response OmpR family regulator
VVEKQGGRIWVTSEPMKGGRGLLMGAVDYLHKPIDERTLLSHVGSIVRSAEPQVVLVADDEQDIRSLIAGHLRRAGHQVLEAADGE